MSYSVCFSSPVTHLNNVYGVAVVGKLHVFAYWSTYSNGHRPTRSDILCEPQFIMSFKSLDDLSSAFMKMNGSIKFYDYEEI